MFLKNKQNGGMDIADILYQIILPIVFFVFITVWNPLIALMNFSAMDYGTTIELLFRMLPLLILAVYVAVQIKKWKSDSLA